MRVKSNPQKKVRASKLIAILTVIFCLVGCVTTADFDADRENADWTIFRGSSALNGNIDRELPEMPKLRWTFANDVRTVASPIIYDSIAYTCDRKGVIRGIDPQGKQCFELDLQTPVEASFLVCDSMMYVGRIDGFVSAISLKDRKEVWGYETMGQISASPNIVRREGGDLILVGSYDNNMYVLNSTDGKPYCQFATGYYINGAASLWNEFMVFGGCDAWLRIANTVTGEQTDSLQLNAYIPASPVVWEDCAYVSDYNGSLYEVKIDAGRFVGHRVLVSADESEAGEGVVSMPTVSRDAIFVLTGDRQIKCINRKDGSVRWQKLLRGNAGESAPLVCRDKVLVCTKDGHVSILQCEDGKEVWHYEVGEQIISSPAIVANGFYILTSRGKLLKFEYY